MQQTQAEAFSKLTYVSVTGLSVAKISITYNFLRSQEMMWDAIDLSIFSINKVCVGIIIATLPSLRSTILGLLSRFLPASLATTIGATSRHQHTYSHTVYSTRGLSRHEKIENDESERYMLELKERKIPDYQENNTSDYRRWWCRISLRPVCQGPFLRGYYIFVAVRGKYHISSGTHNKAQRISGEVLACTYAL